MEEATTRSNFVWEAVEQDLKDGRYTQVHTRFPPEPNGYMHIGHCKALITDFLTAEKFGGKCNLRFDDTNPAKEDTEFVEAIKNDIHWLGFDWTGGLYYASDYYDKCYEIAEDWIRRGLAYVDELNKEQMREYRGTLTKPGKNSPWRDRPLPGHNVALFIENRRNGQTLFYAPGLGEPDDTILPWLKKADCLLIDGTVWQDDELQATGVGRNTGRDMGHLALGDGHGMMALLASLPAKRKILIHINNTNPILNEQSPQRHALAQQGIEVSWDGMNITLQD